jgi:RNA polymerase sigma factor (sigma-70 family)
MKSDDWNNLVAAAQQGDRRALEDIIRGMQDRVHHLAMRMLVNPDDAQDATQEILILIITKLSTFRGESAFGTWIYRVATNYLLTAKKIAARDPKLNFEMFGADLESGLVADPPPSAEDTVMLNELRISCTMAMLLCLDMKHRIAYVLGDILELDQSEASEILNITRESFRKRLSRARREIVAFTSNHCGLANSRAKCACPRRLPSAIALGRISSGHLAYAVEGAPSYGEIVARVRNVEGDLRVLKLQTATPHFKSPDDLGARITEIIQDTA